MKESAKLLAPDALRGARLGISVSESPDLIRLGLLEGHFRLAIAEIARCIVVADGTLVYGGHLRPDGYTAFLIQEIERYGRYDETLLVCLAWQEHREITLSALSAEKARLGLHGKIVCLDPDGNIVDPTRNRGNDAEPAVESAIRTQSLTQLRRHMIGVSHGRVFIGGRREGFQGSMPGLLEEALVAIEAGQPIYLAGGFGGVTYDIARALSIGDAWLPPFASAVTDDRLTQGIGTLVKLTEQTSRKSLDNGLTDQEKKQLAASHRPSEIAALVSVGLGRRLSNKR